MLQCKAPFFLKQMCVMVIELCLFSCFVTASKTCSNNQFTCSNRNCIPSRWRCDGDPDCSDSSDEEGCPMTVTPHTPPVCGQQMFRCTDGHCIKSLWHCDKEEDCADGSDEQGCRKYISVLLTNRKWFSVVCTLIYNNIRHHCGQNVVDSFACAS